jgi:hypothetical protein
MMFDAVGEQPVQNQRASRARRGGQGQSAATIDKERRIAACLSVGMKIAESKFGRSGFAYWHLDANAGSGWNEEVNVPGSPLVFWQVANMYLNGLKPKAFFCDRDPQTMAELLARVGSFPQSALLPGDNEEAIEVFAESIRQAENPRFAVGSLLIDPNGWFYRSRSGNGPPVNALGWFVREFPRIDLILNLYTRAYHLQRKQGHEVMAPADLLKHLGKEHWLVGRVNVGQSRFLQAVGRNVATGDHAKLGLYDARGDIGQHILRASTEIGQTALDLAP